MEGTTELGPSWAETLTLQLVTPELLPLLWREAEALLLKGKSQWEEYFDVEDFKAAVEVGIYQLWLTADEGGYTIVVVTDMVVFPKKKLFRGLFVSGGKLKRALPLLDCLEIWARGQGCDTSVIIGRPAWLRLLSRRGYSLEGVVMNKDISDLRVN